MRVTKDILWSSPPFVVLKDIVHHFAPGVYAKQQHLPAGASVSTHKHAYVHLTIIAQGSAIVYRGDSMERYHAPACILIDKGTEHRLQAITDTTWFCIHPTDETDPLKIDAVVTAED
jgi:quercetin dioxygenase-like cupin family protein